MSVLYFVYQIVRRMQNMHHAHVYCTLSKHKITTETLPLWHWKNHVVNTKVLRLKLRFGQISYRQHFIF